MLDIKLIRKERLLVEKRLKTKDPSIDLSSIISLDEQIRALKQEVEQLKSERNHSSKLIGEMKRKGEDAQAAMAQVNTLGERITAIDHQLTKLENDFELAIANLPNLPMEDIKVALDPKENVCIKMEGEPRHFTFTPKNHVELNEKLHLFDFVRGAKITGTGWPCYRGVGARLEWALLNYMIDTHLKNGFEMWMVPHCVRRSTMYGSGQLPKFEHQLFQLNDKDYPLFLIPTSEVPLNGLHMEEILKEEELPKRYISYTPCFRREAGAAGSQERGLIRVHQFNKVEMFCFTRPEESMQVFDEMVEAAGSIVKGLGLHYRNMLLVTGDMSWASARTVDVEVYLPGQKRYYEVSSVSNCTDFQARRSNTRFKRAGGGSLEFVHTLNGSGLATSRLMVALLENNQQEDGSVVIPEALRPYLGGIHLLTPSDSLVLPS